MKPLSLTVAGLALLAALPAAAQTVSVAGLDRTVYTTAEIETIRDAVEDGNDVLARQLAREYGADAVVGRAAVSTGVRAGGEGQLADWLGVERGSMTYHEMVARRVSAED